MSDQIIPRETVRCSAREAYLTGKSVHQCPEDMIPYQELWTQYFNECYFEEDCEADPCSQ